jgi:hypothetical protein
LEIVNQHNAPNRQASGDRIAAALTGLVRLLARQAAREHAAVDAQPPVPSETTASLSHPGVANG